MREKIVIMVSCILIIMCLPYGMTRIFQGEQTVTAGAKIDNEQDEELIGIVASQVSIDMEDEMLKAQAIIARTQLLWCEKENQEKPHSFSHEEMKRLWGQDSYYDFYQRIKQAVVETNGLVVTFDEEVINPSYHKVSAGMTRDGSQVFENTPYLLGVDSKEDFLSDDYLMVQFVNKKDFYDTYQIEKLDELEIKKDGAGYVTEVKKGKKNIDLAEFMAAYNLDSPCFQLKEMEDEIRIVEYGSGHGYGLSQYGANELAKSGKNYEEILKYYFSGVKIEQSGKH